MIDLSKQSGLSLSLSGTTLHFGEGIEPVKPDIRTLDQSRGVLWNMTATGPNDLYFMYRGVVKKGDEQKFSSKSIRYDITVIAPGMVGNEYIKTIGHYHPEVPSTGVGYPEVYEVIHGTAHYLLQKVDETGLAATDVVILEAKAGDKVVIPPGYGHITINPGKEPLVMSNLIEHEFKSVYGTMATAHGGAYYEVEEDGEPIFVENEHYKDTAEPRMVDPKEIPELGIVNGKPLYTMFLEHPERFSYLVDPKPYLGQMNSALK